ncbi:ComEC/Rec2-related protein [Serinibacter arcticus]|uniref:ComEC/Rec2-related protein n=1 Tax=Serinibacter arcticus TaxID=1655435 RepID=A0A4Z1DZK9_9MICO|nr:ComEC/Rec2-related protein [Serinibacter arcticus]
MAPALAAWAAAAVAVGLPLRARLLLVAAASVAGGVAVWRGRRRHTARHRDRWQGATTTVALAGLLVGLVLGSVLVQDDVRTRGLARALAWSGSSEVVLRTTHDAVPVAGPAPDGAQRVRLEATLLGAETRGERTTAVAPVLVIGSPAWRDVPPGTTVRTTARVRPVEPGERPAALLVAGEPEVVGEPSWWRRATHAIRAGLAEAVVGLPPHAALLPGIGVGDDSRVPDDLADAMRATSLGHLLAVSGAHVAIVLAGVLVLTGTLGRRGRVAVCVAVLGGLVALVGPDPSVVRAVAMGGVVVLALVLGRPAAAIPALATAVTVLVLADPWIAREVGFALSVSATAGLVLGAGPLSALLQRRLPPLLATVLAVPLAAQLACLPVLVLIDPGLATYGVLANALVAPVIPPVTVLALLAAMLSTWWPAGAHGLLWVAQGGTWWIDVVARHGAELPLARLPWPPGLRGLALLVLIVVALLLVLRTAAGRRLRARLAGRGTPALLTLGSLVAVVALAASLVAPWRSALVHVAGPVVPAAFPPPDWRLLQCDVGQGSALLVSTAATGGGDTAVMVDVGPEAGDAAGCLETAGIETIERLVLTHADADHVGGLAAVLAAVDVEEAVAPRTSDERMAEVIDDVRAAGVPVAEAAVDRPPEPLASAPREELGAVGLTTLWPTARSVEIGADVDPNELSLTLWVTTPELTALVHGDLGAAAQQAMSRAWPELLTGPPDVVVVSHHGSPDQDPALLAAAAGRVALVSVGADNDYGHPAPSTVAVLAQEGAFMARTDVCGPIAVAGPGVPTGAVQGRSGVLRVSGCRAPLGSLASRRRRASR